MAELNFGLLTPPGSESIGNAFVRGQDQAQASQMQNLQMQQSVRQGQMAELQYKKALDTEARLNKYYADIAANGGPKTPQEAIQAMLGSGVPHIQDLAAKLQVETLKNQQEIDMFNAAKTGPKAPAVAAPMAPPVTPEPGSFSADVAARKEADPFRVNMLPGAAAAPTVNNLGGRTIEDMIAERDRMIRVPGKAAEHQVTALNADILRASRESPEIATMRTLGYPNTQAGYTAFRDAQRQDRLLTPAEEEQKLRIAKAGRTPAQPVAPTITQIVDPSNPNQMITIDARRYTGGGSGSAGVIGVSGKEPSAALRENKLEAGKTLLADEISNLRRSLDVLNTLEAIPSTERGVLSNLGSSMQASGTGQFFGKVSGTEAQTERDLISSSKLRLVNAIKQATGMSAQQLNSNVELQTMLKSLSDPSQAIETNIRNLDNIETAYVKSAPTSAPQAPAAAAKSYSVTAPNGKTYPFDTPAKAAAFRKAAGIP